MILTYFQYIVKSIKCKEHLQNQLKHNQELVGNNDKVAGDDATCFEWCLHYSWLVSSKCCNTIIVSGYCLNSSVTDPQCDWLLSMSQQNNNSIYNFCLCHTSLIKLKLSHYVYYPIQLASILRTIEVKVFNVWILPYH